MSPVQTVTYVFGLDNQETGAAEGTRTPDPIITNDVLYQLSYSSNCLDHQARTNGACPGCLPSGPLITGA